MELPWRRGDPSSPLHQVKGQARGSLIRFDSILVAREAKALRRAGVVRVEGGGHRVCEGAASEQQACADDQGPAILQPRPVYIESLTEATPEVVELPGDVLNVRIWKPGCQGR